MKNLILITLATLTLSSQVFAKEKGKGGDVVICNGKMRVLDTVVIQQEKYFDIRSNDNYEMTMQQIVSHLKETLPGMATRLQTFFKIFKDKGDLKRSIFWIKGDLTNIEDENLFIKIPSNCSPQIKQAIVLVEKPFKRYYYNAEVAAELEKQKDELSWLLIHEWLREYVTDSDVIRIINAYLHSNQFFQENEHEVIDSLTRLGIDSSRGYPASQIKSWIQEFNDTLPTVNAKIVETYKLLELYATQRRSRFSFNSSEETYLRIYNNVNFIYDRTGIFNFMVQIEGIPTEISNQSKDFLARYHKLDEDWMQIRHQK
ncbi:MAG: hypothetical protein AB7I27_02620 [Bacteriovoracaceae bacterium]